MIRSTVIGLCVVFAIAKGVTTLRTNSAAWEETQETMRWDPRSIKEYVVRTGNGGIHFEGTDDQPDQATMIVTKRAGGSSSESAHAALRAIAVTVEEKNSPHCRITWKWTEPKRPDWSGTVTFELRSPKTVNLRAKSENGRIVVEKLAGDGRLESSNGAVEASTTGNKLNISTNNGRINASFAGKEIRLKTHNGTISADLGHCREIEGAIATDNGPIDLIVGDQTSCGLSARTRNGRATCEPPLMNQQHSSNSHTSSVTGILHGGKGKLTVDSGNGTIRIR